MKLPRRSRHSLVRRLLVASASALALLFVLVWLQAPDDSKAPRRDRGGRGSGAETGPLDGSRSQGARPETSGASPENTARPVDPGTSDAATAAGADVYLVIGVLSSSGKSSRSSW